MRYEKYNKYDVTNGIGVRTSIFFTGCTNNCEGCFNKELQDFNSGKPFTIESENELISYIQDKEVVGASILGGEPMQQNSKEMLSLVKRIKEETKKSIWMWTGLLFEDLIIQEDKREILKYVDVLIDGRFILSKRDLMLKYRGSSNQRVIDVQKSLKENKVVEFIK